MVILHIACIMDEYYKGVCVAVPQHIISQSKYAEVAFINVNNIKIPQIPRQFNYNKGYVLKNLPQPYNSPDLVIFHEVYRFPYLEIYKELKKNNIPYVIIPHGCLTVEAQNNKWFKKFIANKMGFKKLIISSSGVQCLSEREHSNIRFNVNKFIGTNGMDRPSELKKTFHSDSTQFVFIGRIDIHIKGLDILMQAISSIKDFLVENRCQFLIVGEVEGDDSQKLREFVDNKDLNTLVSIHKAVRGKEKEYILLNSDAFILTSRTEGMPMGVLEALNYGIPCLVTEGTSMRHIIESENMGWGCNTDEESISAALQKAVSEMSLLAHKSKNAISVIEKNYRWDNVAKKVLEDYGAIIM